MNVIAKRILLGLIIWALPFLTSFFVWDVELGAPGISMEWFTALMAFTFAVGLAIASILHFRDNGGSGEGWATGITWYVELIVLDLTFLVGLFGMTMQEFYPMLLTYVTAPAVCVAIGYVTE